MFDDSFFSMTFLSSGVGADIIPVLVAALMGGILGLERERDGQTAGFRTTILVAVSGALLMRLSFALTGMFDAAAADTAVRLDPGRLASYAMAGMGFLGAGAIAKTRDRVRGLTTASALWLSCAVGLGCGAGMYVQSVFVSVFALIILVWPKIAPFDIQRDIRIVLKVVVPKHTMGPQDIPLYFSCCQAAPRLTSITYQKENTHMIFLIKGKTGLDDIRCACENMAAEESVLTAQFKVLM